MVRDGRSSTTKVLALAQLQKPKNISARSTTTELNSGPAFGSLVGLLYLILWTQMKWDPPETWQHYFNLLSQLDVCGNFAAAWLPDRWKGTSDNKLIDMAFNKGRADDRKTWMNKYQATKCNKLEMRATFDHKINVSNRQDSQEGTFVDHSKRAVSYEDFVQNWVQTCSEGQRSLGPTWLDQVIGLVNFLQRRIASP